MSTLAPADLVEVVVGPFVYLPARPDRVAELDAEGVVIHWLSLGVSPLDFIREELELRRPDI